MLKKVGKLIKKWFKFLMVTYMVYGISDICKKNIFYVINKAESIHDGEDQDEFESRYSKKLIWQMIYENILETINRLGKHIKEY